VVRRAKWSLSTEFDAGISHIGCGGGCSRVSLHRYHPVFNGQTAAFHKPWLAIKADSAYPRHSPALLRRPGR